MQTIPIDAIPNQSFNVTLDGNLYALTFRTIGELTYCDITLNGTLLVSGQRCVPNRGLIPYRYLEGTGGNFAFRVQTDEYPYFEQFGITQFLQYASQSDLAAIRANNVQF